MTRRRLSTSLLGVLVLMLSLLGIAAADTAAGQLAEPCENGAAGDNNPNCEDGEFDPPCDEDEEKDEPECQDEEEPEPDPEPDPDEGCTDEDTDGLDGNVVASGAIAQASDELAANGAPAPLTDGIDTLNCEVVVTIEQAVEGGGGEPPALPEPPDGLPEPPDGLPEPPDGLPEPPDGLPEPPDGLPELPEPGQPAPPASCEEFTGALGDAGVPGDVTGPLGEGCSAIEDNIPTP